MQPEEQFIPSFSYETEAERARWYYEDFEKGDGWTQATKGPGFTYWTKTLETEEIPFKVLAKFDMPMPAKTFLDILSPSNLEDRKKWDTAFKDHDMMEVYGNDGYLVYMRLANSCPLADRDFVLFVSTTKEIEWYGKKALFAFCRPAWHHSKPENVGGAVRVTNGGNFYVVTQDEENSETCKVFALTNNNFNGWLGNNIITKKMFSWSLPRTFNILRDDITTWYNKTTHS